MLKPLAWLAVALCCCFVSSRIAAQDPDYVLSATDRTGPAGASVDVSMLLDNSMGQGLGGWSFGMCHDPTYVQAVSSMIGDDAAIADNGNPPWFFVEDIFADGFSNAAVVSRFGFTMGPGSGLEMVRVEYELGGPGGNTTSLDYCSTLGMPPTGVVVVIGGTSILPTTQSATLSIEVPENFRRGFCNGDATFDVADPIFLVNALFSGAGPIECPDACDANDDGSVNIADVVAFLDSLFGSGAPLPNPQTMCGIDPTADSLACPVSLCP